MSIMSSSNADFQLGKLFSVKNKVAFSHGPGQRYEDADWRFDRSLLSRVAAPG